MSEAKRAVLVVVEDEPDMAMLIKARLSIEPRLEIVGEASTATAAIELARTTTPGLIILDHAIEGDVMGLEAAPALKQAAPDTKILLFSAFDLASDAAAEPAVDAFLPKSEISRLLDVVRELLEI